MHQTHHSQPNIILINCDDLGWGDLGCTGHPQHQTPHLDRMAAEGTLFTDFYVASPMCSPSRGALMTGCYPRRIGFGRFDENYVLFPGQAVGLNPNEHTIASLLRDLGYATRIVGKWHCGDQPEFLPTNHGFDGYYGVPYSNDMGRQFGGKPKPPLPLLRDTAVVDEQFDQASLTIRYLEDAVGFIRSNHERPFFLYFAHMYVHLPIYVQEQFLRLSTNGRYGAGVATVDWTTGVIMAELKRLGIDEKTLVLFTSDNGSRNDFGPSCGPLRGQKGTTWEGGHRVPCIVRWPGVVPAGRRNTGVVSAIDLLPTLVNLAGGSVPVDRRIDGVDVSALVRGDTDESPRTDFYYYRGNNLEAVRHGNWKLHFLKKGEPLHALYDLSSDVGETTDIAEANSRTVAELNRIAERARTDLGDDATGQAGNCREIGRVSDPKELTAYDETYPYFAAEYDLTERG